MALDNLQPLCYAVITIVFIVGNLSFFGRYYCRLFIIRSFGWDDIVTVGLQVS